jgi:uncharacterized protein (TIGR02466 family)
MNKSQIHGIFPVPIYISNINRNLSKEESNFIKKNKIKLFKNKGNFTSEDNYILKQAIFKKLKKELEIKVKDYFDKIICSSNNIKPYITQSWLNYTENNEYHHVHEHPNSLLSGVFYINADKNNDKIKFFNQTYRQIDFEKKEFNLYNSNTWWFAVETGQVILFPSYLTHSVEIKQGTNTRISLAFNVFISGKIGDNRKLTELFLKCT